MFEESQGAGRGWSEARAKPRGFLRIGHFKLSARTLLFSSFVGGFVELFPTAPGVIPFHPHSHDGP